MTATVGTDGRARPGGAGFTVDPWDPGYAAALAAETLTEFDATTAQLDLDVEVPGDRWRPVAPDRYARVPAALLVADGVRRIDARIWVDGAGDAPAPGIAASYAAGLVRCPTRRDAQDRQDGRDGRDGAAAELVAIEVRRGLFSAAPGTPNVRTSVGAYPAQPAADSTFEKLSLAMQHELTDLEVDVATSYRGGSPGDDLLLVDGPLRGRAHLPRTVGYVKTHHIAYLNGAHAAVVAALRPGQRTPVFGVGTSWSRYTWYLRLPGRSSGPWAGVTRCEASADLAPDDACALADLTARLLPALAGVEYKDPRAPQNLVPIGGLERLLRHRLGDARLLYRALRAAASR